MREAVFAIVHLFFLLTLSPSTAIAKLFVAGNVLFSGSLYALVLSDIKLLGVCLR
jgi:uncharacterized membrane protein YgdD (TMEM256/DUF423 family)